VNSNFKIEMNFFTKRILERRRKTWCSQTM